MIQVPKRMQHTYQTKKGLSAFHIMAIFLIAVLSFVFRGVVYGLLEIPFVLFATGTSFWLCLPSGVIRDCRNYQAILLVWKTKRQVFVPVVSPITLEEKEQYEDDEF